MIVRRQSTSLEPLKKKMSFDEVKQTCYKSTVYIKIERMNREMSSLSVTITTIEEELKESLSCTPSRSQ
jgi:hypothetical protein